MDKGSGITMLPIKIFIAILEVDYARIYPCEKMATIFLSI
jgi:hypothetical protein